MPAPAHAPPSPDIHPSKRHRQSSPDKDSPTSLLSISPTSEQIHDGSLGHTGPGLAGKVGQSSSFRNVSACNRCRLRKNRCDQKLPSCASCEKASVACVGYDPITKREIPRSYIFYLEKRVEQLEGLLTASNIPFPPAQNLDYCSKSGSGSNSIRSPTETAQSEGADATSSLKTEGDGGDGTGRLQPLASKSTSSDTVGAGISRHLGSTSGISFARVVFAAVQSSVSDQKSNSEKGGVRPYRPGPNNGAGASGSGTSMRDSFFGLHTKPTIHPATFPDKKLGKRLITLYFEHANPQIPVLHRVDFMDMFERAYADQGRLRGPRELYVLNMVFAIGAGIILGDSKGEHPIITESGSASAGSRQCQPEEYHASAIVHLEACLGSGGGLENLQAVLLLANFALLRPVPPGLWYIIGVAVRLAVDLGLHYEDGKDVEAGLGDTTSSQEAVTKERGRREYVRDLRRRLWWCTYSYDRLVSMCVGRPPGISDQVITTEFPSLLEDRYITQTGIVEPPIEMLRPTYKLVAHHYFRLRLLQSEILQVLLFRQAQNARTGGLNPKNPYMHTSLPSPFLSKFDSFRSWRIDIDRRLWEWKNSAPTKQDTGVAFSTEFLDLNYWQAIIMLYRQSLSVPTVFEGEYDTTKEVNSPAVYNAELREDEERVYLKVAEAGQKVLRLYRQLHLVGLVNYTYLTTHHLFVAGISYLYAIWHSPIVRSRLTMDEVDFTILAATSVFTDFMDKCPPAEACRDAFDRTVKATLKMVNASGGFGQQYRSGRTNTHPSSRSSLDHRPDWSSGSENTSISSLKPQYRRHQQHQLSKDRSSARPPHIDVASDRHSNSGASASLLSPFQQGAPYRLPGPQPAATKSDADGFSMMQNLALPPRSNASSAGGNAPNPVTPEALSIDPPLVPSPTILQANPRTQPQLQQQQPNATPPAATQLSSPATDVTGGFFSPQQQHQQLPQQPFSPGTTIPFSNLQGMDFLQTPGPGSAGSGASGIMDGADFSGLADTQMDLGFGLGWEGVQHHDFSDGPHLDLFEGFFFGGAGNVAGSGAGGNANGVGVGNGSGSSGNGGDGIGNGHGNGNGARMDDIR